MNWGAFALTAICIVVGLAGFVGTWALLDWVETKFGFRAALVCAAAVFALSVATIVGLNA